MADEGLVDRLEGALIAVRGQSVRRQAEVLVEVLTESGWRFTMEECHCPPGFRFHAANCPVAPNEERLRPEQLPVRVGAVIADLLQRAEAVALEDPAEHRRLLAEATRIKQDFAEVRLRQGQEPADRLARVQGPLRPAVDVAREADVESILEAFVGLAERTGATVEALERLVDESVSSTPATEPAIRLRPELQVIDGVERWGWSFTDADGKGADCRLFCDSSGMRLWGWYPGSPGNPQLHDFAEFHCYGCGKTPERHLLVPSGISACSIVEDGHQPDGLCECPTHNFGMPHGFDREGNAVDCPPNCPAAP